LIYLLLAKRKNNRITDRTTIKALLSMCKKSFVFSNVEQGWIRWLSLLFLQHFYTRQHKQTVRMIKYASMNFVIHFCLACTNNPCNLGGYYTTQTGYQCIPIDPTTAFCTCPNGGGVEVNKPCGMLMIWILKNQKLIFIFIDLCNRTNSGQNVCRNTTGRLLRCLENNDYGTAFACLCSDPGVAPWLTTDADCG
jgi:hypothetical protein